MLEQYSRDLRQRAATNRSDEEFNVWNQLREEENLEKDDLIRTLRDQLEQLQSSRLEEMSEESSYLLSSFICSKLGPELYKSEFSDRILRLLLDAPSGKTLIDPRTRAIIAKIASSTQFSGGAARLEERIKAAGRDSKRAEDRLGEILLEVGFRRRLDGGHPVFIAGEMPGIPQQTLGSSSSDFRAGRNAAAQIVRDLGLGRLKG